MNGKKQSVKATERYLELKGLGIIDRWWGKDGLAGNIDLVAEDGGELVFVSVTPGDLDCDAGFREEPLSREQFELLAATWLRDHADFVDGSVPVRFDRISVLMLTESRAIIRHHVNALTGPFASM